MEGLVFNFTAKRSSKMGQHKNRFCNCLIFFLVRFQANGRMIW